MRLPFGVRRVDAGVRLLRAAVARGCCLRAEQGQAAAEFAIVAVALMTLIFGGIEVGRMTMAQAIVTQAAREGGRVASARCSLEPTCATAVGSAITSALTGLDVAAASWTISSGPYRSGATVQVHVSYDFYPAVGLVAAFFPGGFYTVAGNAFVRLE